MSIKHRVKDRAPDGKMRGLFLCGPGIYQREYIPSSWRWISYSNSPGWWRRYQMLRPARRKSRQLCTKIAKDDRGSGDVMFPLDRKPHHYYW